MAPLALLPQIFFYVMVGVCFGIALTRQHNPLRILLVLLGIALLGNENFATQVVIDALQVTDIQARAIETVERYGIIWITVLLFLRRKAPAKS